MSEIEIAHDGLTWDELADKIDNEGFDYYFTQYERPNDETDPTLRAYWEVYIKAADHLKTYLRSRGGIL